MNATAEVVNTAEVVKRAIAYRILSNAYYHMPYSSDAGKVLLVARSAIAEAMSSRELCEAIEIDHLTRW